MTKTQKAVANYQDYRMQHDGEKFSKKVAKLAGEYIDYANIIAETQNSDDSTAMQKAVKKIENKTIKRLLQRVKTEAGLNSLEQKLLETTERIGGGHLRNLIFQELNICMQIVSETHNEEKARQVAHSLFDSISEHCPQTLDYDYVNRSITKAKNVLVCDGKQIFAINEWE